MPVSGGMINRAAGQYLVTAVTKNAIIHSGPAWSPDGKRNLYASAVH